MKAAGSIQRANGRASYGAALTLLASIALGFIPFSAPASADDRPRPPVAQADVARQREIERQRSVVNEQKRQAELQRSVQALQANELQREIQRQTERSRQESLAAAARVDRQPARASAKPVTPAGMPISLQSCNDSTPQEALAPFGESSLLVGKAWITKSRGVGERLIRGTQVELSVGGVMIANAERFFADPVQLDHPLLGRVWITRWQYPFTMTTPAPIVVGVRWTLEPRLADFAIFNEDGTPLRYPTDFTAALACTLVPAVAVTGRITGAGVGLPDGRVAASDATTSLEVARADTNASGDFAILLRPGAYRFFFFSFAGPWLPEWWDNRTSFNDATTLTLAFGVTPPRLLADLERGVFVSGRTTDAQTHQAVPGVFVNAQRADVACCESFFAETDVDGRYRMVVRKNVTLKVGFFPRAGATPYLDQWWNARPSFNEADAVVIGTTDIANIDAALERGVFVRGRVTDAETGLPLANASVSASVVGVACCQNFFASTDAQGEYAMAVRTNVSIVVGFFPPLSAIPYIPSYWDGRQSFAEADHLPVGTVDISGIDGALEHGVFLRGRVTDATTGAGVAAATVYASVTPCCGAAFFAQTALDGTYVTAVPKNVTLVVQFLAPFQSPIPYVTQWYRGRTSFATADPVVVTTLDVAGIDAALERGVFLRGHVSEAGTGAPIPLANVNVSPAGVPCCESSFASADAHGDYAVAVRKNIVVTVMFSAPFGSEIPYLQQWYHGKLTFETADPVTVGSSDVFGIDAALERGVFVRGLVTDAETHEAIAGVSVSAYDAALCCSSAMFASTDARGEYRVVSRQNAAVKVNFSPPFGGPLPYIGQWYQDKATFDSADVVAVGATDVTGIDAALERGVFLHGHVTEAETGQALSQVSVNAFIVDAPCCENFFGFTNTAGDYAMAVRSNVSLKVSFYPPFGSDLLQEYYDNKTDFSSADVVPVGITEITGINAALERGVRLSGRVTDTSGAGIANVSVNVETENCCAYVAFTQTAIDGSYSVALRAGRYKVGFSPPLSSNLLFEYYNDKPNWSVADIVIVGATPVAGIDAMLESGAPITGRVTDAATGLGVEGVFVSVQTAVCCEGVTGTQTGAGGSYSVLVRPGSYKVGFFPPASSDLLYEFYDNVTDVYAATVLLVEAAPVSGIDAVLDHGVRVSGRVSDPEGRAVLPWANVDLVDPLSGAWLAGIGTNADGTYSLTVRPGSYKVDFVPPLGSDLLIEYYNNKPTFSEADVLSAVVGTPLVNIDATLERGLTILDARMTQNLGSSNFGDLGDAFTLTFSAAMDLNFTADAIQVQDQDGTTVTFRCGVVPNRVACQWDAPGTTLTVTVDLNVPVVEDNTGTTPGFQIPFNIATLTGFTDVGGNTPNVLASPDRLVDFE